MNHTDSVLRTYAESGLRSMEEWITLGREVAAAAKPRVDTTFRGAIVSLYSRDQTHPRTRTRPKQV